MVREPARVAALVNAALIATVNLVAYLLEWAGDTVVLVNIVVAAWVAVAGELVRARVATEASIARHDLVLAERLFPD
jgi:hypothetical protein